MMSADPPEDSNKEKDGPPPIAGEESPPEARIYTAHELPKARVAALRNFREILNNAALASSAGMGEWSSASSKQLSALASRESELAKLRNDFANKVAELEREQTDSRTRQREMTELQEAYSRLQEHQQFSHLLSRVNQAAQEALKSSDILRSGFKSGADCTAFVVSVDIRRSTDLMLKAKSPERFATFISGLCDGLATVIKENYGVFDKFTGDGVLAFFPEFFSGPDAGFYAVRAAEECHRLFNAHYTRHRTSFSSVLKDVGLGIGVDHGQARLLQIADGLTIVGRPVVYACRLSGASAGVTLVNQPAYEQLHECYSGFCRFAEDSIEIKHEGRVLAYRIELAGKDRTPALPDWIGEGGEPSEAPASDGTE